MTFALDVRCALCSTMGAFVSIPSTTVVVGLRNRAVPRVQFQEMHDQLSAQWAILSAGTVIRRCDSDRCALFDNSRYKNGTDSRGKLVFNGDS